MFNLTPPTTRLSAVELNPDALCLQVWTAARQALAKQIAYNMAHDRATQIVLDLSKIPRPFADLLRIQLQIEINQAAINTIVWQAAVDALTPKES